MMPTASPRKGVVWNYGESKAGVVMVSIFSIIQLAGVALLLSALVRLWRMWQLRRRGIRTTGTVIEYVQDGGPWIRFKDQHGNPRYFTPGIMSPWKRAWGEPIGTQVEVVYLPEDPKQARLLVDTTPVDTEKTLEGRAWRYAHFKVGRFHGETKRVEDRLRRELRVRGLRTTGTVVAEEPPWLTGKRINSPIPPTTGFPRVQFADQRGEPVTFVHSEVVLHLAGRRFPRLLAIGEQVPVVYLPESPQVTRIPRIFHTFMDLASRLSFGLLLLLFVRSLK